MSFWGSTQDQATYTKRAALVSQKYPNITVQANLIASNYDQKIQTMIAGGKGPDIMELAETVHGYSSKGQIIALDDLIKQNNVDLVARYGEKVAGLYARNGHTYAMPDRGGAMTLYYNKDMFTQAGLAFPTKDWGWSDLLNACQKLTVRDGDKITRWGLAAGDWWPWWVTFIYQNGGKLIDDSGKPAINSPEAIEAVQFYVDLVTKYKVSVSLKDYANFGQGIGPDQLFSQGKAAMTMTGFWAIGTFSKVPGLNFDIAPLFHGKQPATVLMANGLAISKDCKHPQEAFLAIDFLTSVEGQRPIVESRTDAPANRELLNSPEFLDYTVNGHKINMQAYPESVARIYIPPMIPQWNEMITILTNEIDLILNGKEDVPTGMNKMQKKVTDLLQQG